MPAMAPPLARSGRANRFSSGTISASLSGDSPQTMSAARPPISSRRPSLHQLVPSSTAPIVKAMAISEEGCARNQTTLAA